jgi:CRP/FNR family transcriptional regulator
VEDESVAPSLASAVQTGEPIRSYLPAGVPAPRAWPETVGTCWDSPALRSHGLDPLDAIATLTYVDRDRAIFRETDPADSVYQVVTGVVRIYKMLADGRRQIIGFLEPGDFLGLSFNETFLYTAEAVTTASLRRFNRHKLEALLDQQPNLHRLLLAITANELVTAQDQMLMLGRKTAKEKICTFLIQLSAKAVRRGLGGNRINMPMNRTDIADYLGLTIETVSRTFTALKTGGLIRLLDGHRIELTDSAAITELAEITH